MSAAAKGSSYSSVGEGGRDHGGNRSPRDMGKGMQIYISVVLEGRGSSVRARV
jgi:hypothetical protein